MRIGLDSRVYEFSNGRYLAKFLGVKVQPADGRKGVDGNEMGDGFRWGFIMASGPDKGKVITVVTQQEPTRKNACGRMIRGLTNKELEPGDDFDSEQYTGGYYYVTIRDGVLKHDPAPSFLTKDEASVEKLHAQSSANADDTPATKQHDAIPF